MSSAGRITVQIPGMNIDGVQLHDRAVDIPQHYALYTRNRRIIYFDRLQDNWHRVSESQIRAGGIIHILDPITALMRGLATADEIGLGGVETLVALLKPQ